MIMMDVAFTYQILTKANFKAALFNFHVGISLRDEWEQSCDAVFIWEICQFYKYKLCVTKYRWLKRDCKWTSDFFGGNQKTCDSENRFTDKKLDKIVKFRETLVAVKKNFRRLPMASYVYWSFIFKKSSRMGMSCSGYSGLWSRNIK